MKEIENSHNPLTNSIPSLDQTVIDRSTHELTPITQTYQNLSENEERVLRPFILKLSFITWNWILCSILIIIILLMIGALTSHSWVSQGKQETFWRGGLTICEKCDGKFEEESYGDIARYMCDMDEFEGFCELYEELAIAGSIFQATEITALVLAVVWIVRVSLAIRKKQGWRDSISYTISTSCTVIHIVGLLAWFIITEASFLGPCEKIGREKKEKVCATDGPRIGLVILFLLFFLNLLFLCIYKKRFTNLPKLPNRT